MKWYAVPALLACSLNFMLASITLSLAVYHVLTDSNGKNPPVEPKMQWIHLVTLLIPFTAFWMLLSAFGMYVSMTKKQMYATLVLTFYVVCCGGSMFFMVEFGNQVEVKDTTSDVLYEATLLEITTQAKQTWIPAWLDKFQKNSKFCCGIKAYRDYEKFWPATPSRLPRSCCKDDSLTPVTCPVDTSTAFPNTPDDFFKVDVGCADEVLEALRRLIRESHYNCITMTAFIVCGIVAYLLLYAILYLSDEASVSGAQARVVGLRVLEGGDSAGLVDSVVLDESFCAGSLESIQVQPLLSLASTADQGGGSSTVRQVTLVPAALVSSSATKMNKNKKNAVIAGLEQQQKIQKLQQTVTELQQLQQQQQYTQQQQHPPQQFQHPTMQSLDPNLLQESAEGQQRQQLQLFQQLQQAQQLQQQQIQRLQQLTYQSKQQSQVLDTPLSEANLRAKTASHQVQDAEDKIRGSHSNHKVQCNRSKDAGACVPQQSSSADDLLALARVVEEEQHEDPAAEKSSPGSPMGSSRGRLKKVRRDAMRSNNKK